jgi:hypothetical protein
MRLRQNAQLLDKIEVGEQKRKNREEQSRLKTMSEQRQAEYVSVVIVFESR